MKRLLLWLLLVAGPAAAHAQVAIFTRQPQATDTPEGVRIEFIVGHITDVAVDVTDEQGAVVRHLAAGKLGQDAPPPLTKDAYGQTLLWDRKNDAGRPVPAGTYTVRVRLGLRTAVDRILGERIGSAGQVLGLAVDPRRQELYVLGALGAGEGRATVIQVRDKDGRYLRTLLPYPASLEYSQVGGFKVGNGWVPRVFHAHAHALMPALGSPMRQTMALTARGGVYFDSGAEPPGDERGPRRVLLLEGGYAAGPRTGPLLPPEADAGHLHMALAPNETYLYLSGLRRSGEECEPLNAVYRVRPTDPGPPEPWLGVPGQGGKAEGHFDDPRGLAVGAGGQVYVADYHNDRICVFDGTGRWLGAIPCTQPDQVFVHPKTGALYVLSIDQTRRQMQRYWDQPVAFRKKRIVKLAGWKAGTEPAPGPAAGRILAALDLSRDEGFPVLTLDPTADPPVLWYSEGLTRIEDRGSALAITGTFLPPSEETLAVCGGLAVDAARDEVYVDLTRRADIRWTRLSPRRGRPEPFNLRTRLDGDLTVGGDGLIYVRFPGRLVRYDRSATPQPFHLTASDALQLGGREIPAGGVAVHPDGTMYVLRAMGEAADAPLAVDVYAPDGALKSEGLITGLTPGATSLAVDPAGNIFVADALRPATELLPPALASVLPAAPRMGDGRTNWYALLYGSVLRFPPGGGTVSRVAGGAGDYVSFTLNGRQTYAVSGVSWISPGPAPVTATGEAGYWLRSRFGVDGFGRAFVPHALTSEVQVLDPGGNELTRVGVYGNADVRPGRSIPLAWPAFVGVSESACYVLDLLNQRVVRLRLDYARLATVKVEVK